MSDMTLVSLRQALERDPNLPTLPEHVQKLLQLVADEEVPIPVLAREIQKDPALTLKLLRLANSALYGQSREVTSLERAFSVIGTSDVPAMIAGMASVNGCERFVGDPHFRWKDFWAHCSGTAFIAASLARRIGTKQLDAGFLGGLLHDVGYLALTKLDRTKFAAAVQDAVKKHGFLPRFLQERFGVSPEDAGGVLAEVSRLPADMQQVIRFVHDPAAAPKEARELVSLVSLANELAHLFGLTFFRGTADSEVVLTALPAWRLLSSAHPEMVGWDLARFGLELEKEGQASESFLRASQAG